VSCEHFTSSDRRDVKRCRFIGPHSVFYDTSAWPRR